MWVLAFLDFILGLDEAVSVEVVEVVVDDVVLLGFACFVGLHRGLDRVAS